MPTIDAALPGSPCWIELMSVDQAASAAFYAALFGWTSTEPNPEMGGYANFFLDGQIVAGLTLNRSEGAVSDRWNTYLKAADAQAVVEATPTHGGQVHFGPHQVTDLGSMSMIDDAGGATVGVWQPGTLKGYAAFGVPGAPVWHELMTRDYDKTLEFYRDVFGWDTHAAGDTDALVARPERCLVEPHLVAAVAAFPRGHRSQVECPPSLTVLVQPGHLDQILANLMENAVRHGEGTVSLKVVGTGRDGDEDLAVTVSDEGEGIAPEHYPMIFTRFWHGSRRGGTGLGLYVVRGLVEAHGGKISVGRAKGGGAEFRFTLPAGAPEHVL